MTKGDGTPRPFKTGRVDRMGRRISVATPNQNTSDGRIGRAPLPHLAPGGFDLYEIDEGLVAARTALFDAVEVLGPQAQSLTLIGAQAVYERTGYEHSEGAPPATNDADFALNPELLVTSPAIGEALRSAGYALKDEGRPGVWKSPNGIGVDLLVPESIAGAGSRAARLPIDQGKNAVGRAGGLELTLIDYDEMLIKSLNPDDERSCKIKVAGVAALLCSKWTKLAERIADEERKPKRLLPKDAVEVWRLMQTSPPESVAEVFRTGTSHDHLRAAIITAAEHANEHFGSANARGSQLIGIGTGKSVNDADSIRLAHAAAEWTTQFREALNT